MSRIKNSAAAAVLVALCVLVPAIVPAQSALPLKHNGKPTQPAITSADLMTRIYIFADDSMGGRLAGEESGLRGTAYIEREVRRLGLVPGGDNGTFFQAVPLYSRAFDPSSQLTAGSTALTGMKDYFPIHAGGTARRVNGAQVIFAGSTLDTAKLIPAAQTVGKAVLVTGPTAGLRRRYPGAVAFIAVPATQQLPIFQRAAAASGTTMRRGDDTTSQAILLATTEATAQAFLGVPLANARPGTVGATLTGDVKWKETDAPARNVVAIVPGSDPKLKGQYVAIGAHSDHVGTRRQGAVDHDSLRAFNAAAQKIIVARTGHLPSLPGSGLTPDERASIKVNVDSLRRLGPARLDSVYNGADDDASGSMGALEIAEMFATAKVKPKRSLIFVWHTGEEMGLFGAEYFTDHP
ncbi:MAG TPA: M28 family peptidase, partial [Gemmatimonadaceae bacterium]|nr:M28 family peptidase [Gemmatimonadaceae bacterium]